MKLREALSSAAARLAGSSETPRLDAELLMAHALGVERERLASERAGARKSMVGSGDRSERIRTYNFPQGRVTDHRINLTLHRLPEILAGPGLEELVSALIAEDEAERLATIDEGA